MKQMPEKYRKKFCRQNAILPLESIQTEQVNEELNCVQGNFSLFGSTNKSHQNTYTNVQYIRTHDNEILSSPNKETEREMK